MGYLGEKKALNFVFFGGSAREGEGMVNIMPTYISDSLIIN